MARNRKYRSAAIRFGPALKALLLCLLIGGSGVGYVWQKSQIDRLGRQIKTRENALGRAQEQNEGPQAVGDDAVAAVPRAADQGHEPGPGPAAAGPEWRLPEPEPSAEARKLRQMAASRTELEMDRESQ